MHFVDKKANINKGAARIYQRILYSLNNKNGKQFYWLQLIYMIQFLCFIMICSIYSAELEKVVVVFAIICTYVLLVIEVKAILFSFLNGGQFLSKSLAFVLAPCQVRWSAFQHISSSSLVKWQMWNFSMIFTYKQK